MRIPNKPLHILIFVCLISTMLLAQGVPLSTLTGKVSTDGAALPGVTVSVTSPNLQGVRTTYTSGAGDYILNGLPPGDYTVRFELAGMQTVQKRITLTAARTEELGAEMRAAALEEAITVTAETPMTAVLESTQVSTNFKQDLIEQLPVARNLEAVTLLSPGVNSNGPGGNIVISGAMSYDSLYLINGVVVNENLRGQPQDLFIEDAIQETTVLTGGISAEYGRFTGGVVNAVTKSGSNEFKGSFRDNITNDDWTSTSPYGEQRLDEINDVYEATFGGPILRDRLWFFSAGRYRETADLRETEPRFRTGDIDPQPITYDHGFEETRLEGKLTASITPKHSVIASYVDIDEVEFNQSFTSNILDTEGLIPERETPNTLLGLNYNGSLTSNLFLEAQYSEREFAFVGGGSPHYDLIQGTLMLDRSRSSARYNSATFKNADPEERNNDYLLLKGSYFLSTDNFGRHDIKVGVEDFNEFRRVNNYQSGSDYRVYTTSAIIRGTQVFPVMRTGTSTRIYWTPILVESEGSTFNTQSIFVNDTIDLNDNWSFNAGVRYDKNDGKDGRGITVADDDAISPRLAVHFDPREDGRYRFNATYGSYVSRVVEGVANDGDPAGRNASFRYYYRGPSINSDVNAPTEDLIPVHQALQMMWDWFFANGGTEGLSPYSVSIPGVETIIDPNGLDSPKMDEYTLGASVMLGSRGYIRGDLVFREWKDFYADFTNTETGQITDDYGNSFDLTIVGNSNVLKREYEALQTQFSYRFTDSVSLGGTYTYSTLEGNVNGEDSSSGPLSANASNYPEYRQARWNYPMGYLTADQRHRLRVWAGWDFPTTRIGDFNLSVLQHFDSGTRSSMEAGIDPSPYVENPGYLTPPEDIDYFFGGGRGNLSTDDVTRTDLALNWAFDIAGIQLFVQPEILNLFDEAAVISFDEGIETNLDDDDLLAFNPFTEEPVEGVHWRKSDTFGQPSDVSDYQMPRTFRVSVGVRF